MNSGIYCIKNIANNKRYIGQAKNPKTRWNRHKNDLNQNKHQNEHLQRAWNKYRKDNFIFEIIEVVEDDNIIDKREDYWIKHFKTLNKELGYNIREAGKNAPISEETKVKISKSKKGKKLTEDHKKKLSIAGKKRKLTEDHKEKLRVAGKNRKHSEESKRKMSEIKKGKKLSIENKRNICKSQAVLTDVEVIDILNRTKNGETINSISIDYGDKGRIIRIIKNTSYIHVDRNGFENLQINRDKPAKSGRKSSITEEQARQIINMLRNKFKMVEIENITGVSYSIIRKIKDGITWTHITNGKIK